MSRTRRGRRFFGSVRADLFVPYEFVMRLPRSGEQLPVALTISRSGLAFAVAAATIAASIQLGLWRPERPLSELDIAVWEAGSAHARLKVVQAKLPTEGGASAAIAKLMELGFEPHGQGSGHVYTRRTHPDNVDGATEHGLKRELKAHNAVAIHSYQRWMGERKGQIYAKVAEREDGTYGLSVSKGGWGNQFWIFP